MVWVTQGPVTFHLAKRRDSTSRQQSSWCALVSTLVVGNALVDSQLVVSQDNYQLCKQHLQKQHQRSSSNSSLSSTIHWEPASSGADSNSG